MAVHSSGVATYGVTLSEASYVERVFLASLDINMVMVPLGVPSTLPDHHGKNARWNDWSQPAALTAGQASEGTDPVDVDYTTTPYTATLLEFKASSTITKMVVKTGVSSLLEKHADRAGYQAALTFDTLTIADVDASTTVVDSGTAMTASALLTSVKTLETNNVKTHAKTPGGRFYCGVFHSDSAYDMINEGAPTWFQAKSSDYMDSLVTPMEGTPASAALYKTLIKVSNNVQNVSSEYFNLVFGEDAFGVAAIDNTAIRPQLIITPPDARVDRAARDLGTIAWIGWFDAVLFGNARTVVCKADI